MAYDQELVERVKVLLEGKGSLDEKKMFGGYCFILNGKMCVAVHDHELMVHMRHEDYEAALAEDGARPMMHRDKQVIGVVYVAKSFIASDAALQKWIDRALTFNAIAQSSNKSGHR